MNFSTIKHLNFPASLYISVSILSFTISANAQTARTPVAGLSDRTNARPLQTDRNGVIDCDLPQNVCGPDRSSTLGKLPIQEKQFESSLTSAFRLPVLKNSEASAKSNSGDDGWHYAFAPYFYLTGIRGTVGARGRTIDLDASFGKVWDNLDLGIMGTVEVSKKRFVSLTDIQWIKLSNKRDTPGGLFDTAKVGINLFILDPEAGYRVFTSKAGALDVLGGARIWSVETNLNVTSGRLPGFDVSQRKTFAAPVVGVRGLLNLSSRFYVSGKFDIGGAGIGADLTTQVFGGVGYRIFRPMALVGGYRYLQVDYDDSKGFLFDTRMNGFVIGAKFSF
jgi:hypothetical protein